MDVITRYDTFGAKSRRSTTHAVVAQGMEGTAIGLLRPERPVSMYLGCQRPHNVDSTHAS